MHDDITDVPGITVGHDTNTAAMTGCTVILCDPFAIGGVDVRGGAPGTRETDLLSPTCLVQQVNAVLLTGGSAFGLDAASGVMRALETQGIGYDTGFARVPIVPAAVLYDLGVGDPTVRPDAASGARAVEAATAGPIAQGSVGAGTGATFNKIAGTAQAKKGGIGSASIEMPDGTIVGALVAVNAFGDVRSTYAASDFLNPTSWLEHPFTRADDDDEDEDEDDVGSGGPPLLGNTTLAVVATSAFLDKSQANKLAQMAHDGLARVINPLHTPFDGDVVFALSLPDRTEIQFRSRPSSSHSLAWWRPIFWHSPSCARPNAPERRALVGWRGVSWPFGEVARVG